ncbi:glucan endo-1,3-beta-D-glucosidase [Microdochium nivale]|nr:glucan endo-1,3-beta-D-glucosidase [Microdochium nivale]
MSARRYSFGSESGERAPLGNQNQSPSRYYPPSSSRHQHQHHDYDYDPRHNPEPAYHDHPTQDYDQPRHHRRRSRTRSGSRTRSRTHDRSASSSERGPPPPAHRSAHAAYQSPASNTTPGADDFSESAGGGMQGLAISVADRNPRESGMAALRGGGYEGQGPSQQYSQQGTAPEYQPSPFRPSSQQQRQQQHGGYYEQTPGYGGPQGGYGTPHSSSSPSLTPMGAAAFPSGRNTPRSNNSVYSHNSDPFTDGHLAYGQRLEPGLGQVNPSEIDDDGDDGMHYGRPARNSMLSFNNSSNRNVAAGAGAGAAAGGIIGGVIGRNRHSAATYDPVNNPSIPYSGGAARSTGGAEKSAWLAQKESRKKRNRWIVIIIVCVLIAAAITGGVLGGLLVHKGGNDGSGAGKGHSGQSADDDTAQNGDLGINSDEIKALMNNPNLHKVFPGVDYTPLNVQYPDCIHNPPSQNNITRDVAVISQLTNTLRLYGTDCNQTEMAIHAIRQLKLEDTMKIWMGVWQDGNTTTNERQLNQMWHILDQFGSDHFKGVIVANEILFRKQMNLTELSNLLTTVRTNLTSHGWTLPVATSDLGNDWSVGLGQASDYIMSNVHPFFSGTAATDAAAWTSTFWETQNKPIWKADKEKNIIAEIGWPTKGGTQCPQGMTSCPNSGSVASIDGLNQLLEDWVCAALTNGTNYFWFELFDEPWKISFNTPGKEWEDQWGLMDVNRNLKPGVKIPSCGGRTV